MNVIRRYFICLMIAIPLLMSGCADEESSVSSGGGGTGILSDGGATSAVFAGTYIGMIRIIAEGDEVDTDSTKGATLLVRTNGTVKLTIEGDSIEGAINGSAFGFSIRIIENDGLVECDANASLIGVITGMVASGDVTGSGDCEVIAAKTGFDVTGTFTATKI